MKKRRAAEVLRGMLETLAELEAEGWLKGREKESLEWAEALSVAVRTLLAEADKSRDYAARYRKEHPDKRRETERRYKERNAEAVKERNRKYNKKRYDKKKLEQFKLLMGGLHGSGVRGGADGGTEGLSENEKSGGDPAADV